MNKVLFLDVDGVLNNGGWAFTMQQQGVRVYRDDLLYEPSLEQLRRVVRATGALIVVSSAWRQIPTCYLHLQEWIAKYDMGMCDNSHDVGGV